jgi:hypothetical protein
MNEEGFWSRVKKTDGCWEYTGGKSPKGYGWVYVGMRKGKMHYMRANRLSWIYCHGEIPEGMLVCHKCDNPSCVRPDHLFLGTHKDNYADSQQKQRHSHGARNGNTKLNEADVEVIRELYRLGVYQRTIAALYGIRQSSAWAVIHRKTHI